MKNKFLQLVDLAKEQLTSVEDAPFIVAIMGQTGVGKSSLLNALFNTDLKTDPVRPCTKEIEKVEAINEKGFKMWFFDLPGIGESDMADKGYMEKYIAQINQSDIIIWALHADNRSVTFDLKALKQLMSLLRPADQKRFINNLTIVLTKADVLYNPSWVFGLMNDTDGIFHVPGALQEIFEQKSQYYQETFLKPFEAYLESVTYNDSNCTINTDVLWSDKEQVFFKGIFNESYLNQFISKYPEHTDIFRRLYANQKVICLSSYFRYNLNELLRVISDKLSGEAAIRIGNFLTQRKLNQVLLDNVKASSNLVIYDLRKRKTVFDLSTINFQ